MRKSYQSASAYYVVHVTTAVQGWGDRKKKRERFDSVDSALRYGGSLRKKRRPFIQFPVKNCS